MSNLSQALLINNSNASTSASTNSTTSNMEMHATSNESGHDSMSSTNTQETQMTTLTSTVHTSSGISFEVRSGVFPPQIDPRNRVSVASAVLFDSNSGPRSQTPQPCQPVNIQTSPTIYIELHSGHSHKVELADNCKSVEEVCISILRQHFPELGPAAAQLFGLASIEKKRMPKIIWQKPCSTFEEIKQQLSETSSSGKHVFFLRIRFIPGKKFINQIRSLGRVSLGRDLLKYFYCQCKDDFVKSRMTDIYGQEIKNEAKARGYAVLSIYIASRMESKDAQEILDRQKLEAFLPSNLIPSNFIVRFFKVWKLKKNMKSKIKDFSLQHQATSLEELWLGYIKDILNEIKGYGCEYYEGQQPSRANEKVTLHMDVQMNEERGNTAYKGLFIGNEFFSTIEDFRAANITPNHLNNTWNVHLDRSSGCSEVICFESKAVVESFVSGLDGYYRLIRDYYMSLCQQVEPPSLVELNKMKCHGPIDTNTAVKKLKTKYMSEEFYILKQSVTAFDQFAILFCYAGQTRKRNIDKKNGKYCLEGEPETKFKDINSVVRYMVDVRSLLPKNPVKVKPHQEPADVLRKLFVEEIILDEDEEESANLKRNQPILILPDDLKLSELIDIGNFTEVYTGELHTGNIYAVKFLRTSTSPEQLYHSYEPFQHAVRELMKLQEPKYFVKIHGMVLTSPPRLVMEKAQFGSLSTFFKRRRKDQPITLHHLMYAATQLAQGMLYMSEQGICHGNICCRNILVFKYELNDIMIKIGDPGMVKLLNTLALSNDITRRRLPWLAPELIADLSKMTLQSEMFAFGTTVWEMFSFGCNPVDLPPLKDCNSTQIIKILKESNKIPITPIGLIIKPEYEKKNWKYLKECRNKINEIMRKCWDKPEDRPGANLVLRDLRSLLTDYGATYHLYSDIPHGLSSEPDSSMSDLPQSSIPSRESSGAVPDIISHTSIPAPTHLPSPGIDTQRKSPVVTKASPKPTVTTAVIPKESPQQFEQKPSPDARPKASPSTASESNSGRLLPELPMDLKYLIPSTRLDIRESKIGQGHYGVVKRGVLYPSAEDKSSYREIAAKELKGDFQNVLDSKEFKAEAILMSKLKHKNIVQFLGISDNMLILEYVENGALSVYLRKFRKQEQYLPTWKLVKMVHDVAQGMAYLSKERIIHCDLAGRNVLLTKDLQTKITDFGLAKILQMDKDYYTRSKEKELPLYWCAPEGIASRKFTSKSDVWSFGILVWEIFTHAKNPVLCEKFSIEGYQKLSEGKRLHKPTRCPTDVYVFMKTCWEFKPEDRPDFEKACNECRKLSEKYPEEAPPISALEIPAVPEPPVNKALPSPSDIPEMNPVPNVISPTVTKEPELINTPSSPTTRPNQLTPTTSPTSPTLPSSILKSSSLPSKPLPVLPSKDLSFLIKETDLHLEEDKCLGQGMFGSVVKGTLNRKGQKIKIAAKKFKNDLNEKLKEIEIETDIMGSLDNPFIVKFYGYLQRPEYILVMEFVENGSLADYLQKEKKNIPDSRLMAIITDIASGMDYLSGKKVFHCDLAARNILLTEDFTAKIGDFGLSKLMTAEKDYYRMQRKKMIPLFWSAPEVISQEAKLSSKADVWSYGVVMWECFSHGGIPNLSLRTHVNTYFDQLCKGFRLPKPENCHEEVYGLMEKCWSMKPVDRPNFSQIYSRCLQLQEMIGKGVME